MNPPIFIYSQRGIEKQCNNSWGLLLQFFFLAFPEATPIYDDDNTTLPRHSILLCPRIFNYNISKRTFTFSPMIGKTFFTDALIIGSFCWDSEILPLKMLNVIGRADYAHFPSQFLVNVFKHPKSFVFPYPIKGFKKRSEAPKARRIGLVVSSLHPRKNLHLLTELAADLPQHKILIAGVTRELLLLYYPEIAIYPNIEILGVLSENTLEEFYHSLDWFISLSGGEGYGLPVREALACGVPIIVPNHTAFSELAGTKGVIFVSSHPYKDEAIGDDALYYAPNIGEIVNTIKETRPPEPDEVVYKPTTYDEWIGFWRTKIEELWDEFKHQRKQMLLVEHPFLYAQHAEMCYLGLNFVARLWAKRTNGALFHTHSTLPSNYNFLIIVPYYYTKYKYDIHYIYPLLRALTQRNPKATVILWLHNCANKHLIQTLSTLPIIIATTTERLAKTISHGAPFPILPNPFGYPPKNENGDYWLFWGVNHSVYPYIPHLVSQLNREVVLLLPKDSVVVNGMREMEKNAPKVKLMLQVPVDDETLEEIVDNAFGYICLDMLVNYDGGEMSAKIPYVLRKGKPIVANIAPRNLPFRSFLDLVDLNISGDWRAALQHIATLMNNNPEIFKPKKCVPSLNDELKFFTENFLGTINELKRLKERLYRSDVPKWW